MSGANRVVATLRRAALQARAAAGGLGLDRQAGALFLITGGGDWAVKQIALGLQPHLAPAFKQVTILDLVVDRPYLSGANLHFLCRPAFFTSAGIPPLHASNRVVVSWLHGGKGDPHPEIAQAALQLERHWRRVRRFIVPNSMTLGHVLECGVDPRLVHMIPNGVDTRMFQPAQSDERAAIRASLGLPPDAFVVGSFQRDEDDQGRPKAVKGPDVLVDALARARREAPVHALLTGPTRGFVRSRLEALGVPYTHAPRSAAAELPKMYHAIDAYCVSSREEGGPATLRESMASGVPVVSTRVGLAIDLIEHARNGVVVDVEDAHGLAAGLVRLAHDVALRQRIAAAALETVRALDYAVIARRYRDEVYSRAFA